MRPRFWIDHVLTAGLHELPDTEAHHARHVLRLVMGASVELFDGRGASATGFVEGVTKKSVQVRVDHVEQAPPPCRPVILATAVPKGDRMDWLVEKATELGVSRLIPLKTARSAVDPRDSKLDRLRTHVVAACKQARRNFLMEIDSVTSWDRFLASLPTNSASFIAHPGSPSLATARRTVDECTHHGPICIAIGPEWGFSDEEFRAAWEYGLKPVALGPYILRIETAALAAVAGLTL